MTTILAHRYALSIALRYARDLARRHVIPAMKTVEEVRRERLKELRVEFETLAKLNEKLGLDRRDSTLSQILNSAKNSKTGKGKEMGSPLARRLEDACGKGHGWMDTDPELLADPLRKTLSLETMKVGAEIDTFDEPVRAHVQRMCMEVIRFARSSGPHAGRLDDVI